MIDDEGVSSRRRNWVSHIWRSGGNGERAVFIVFLLGLAVIAILLGAVIVLPSSTFRPGGWRQLGLVIVIAGFSITSVYTTIFDGMMTARYFRLLVETDKHLTNPQREFLSEWARTKETLGVDGQFQGSVMLGFGYGTLYLAFLLSAFPYVILTHPHLGDLTAATFAAFVIPTFVAAYVYGYRRFKRIEREATARGLRIVELRRELRPRLRPTNRRRLE